MRDERAKQHDSRAMKRREAIASFGRDNSPPDRGDRQRQSSSLNGGRLNPALIPDQSIALSVDTLPYPHLPSSRPARDRTVAWQHFTLPQESEHSIHAPSSETQHVGPITTRNRHEWKSIVDRSCLESSEKGMTQTKRIAGREIHKIRLFCSPFSVAHVAAMTWFKVLVRKSCDRNARCV